MEVLADKYITGLYQDLEREVIADIARRVKKTGRFTETAELMAKSMREQGYSPEQIRIDVMNLLRANVDYQREVAQNTKEYKAYVQELINETFNEARKNGEVLFNEAANMSFNNDLSMWEEHGEDLSKPSSLSMLADSAAKQTNDQFRNLTQSTGFRNTKLGSVGVMNAYQKEMDLALLKVATGTFSYDQAVNDCVARLAQSGLRSIDYESGRTYQLDTAARMCVRTGLGQLTGKITVANLQEMGHDLVITSQHAGSRPEHVVWQNKVFSYSGKNKKYPDFVKSTGYGTVTGLQGANCRHDFYPYWEGDYIPPDLEEPDPIKVDGKEYTYYQATQRQRQMERDIRATKREIEAQGAIGGDTEALRSRLRYQTQEYHSFSDAVGIRAKDNRLCVASGSSNLSKTYAYTYMNRSIIKSQNKFDELEMYRREKTYRKIVGDIEIIDDATYNRLIKRVKKNGGTIIRGTEEVEEHLSRNGSTASCIGNVILFRENATVSDVLEETYHFMQNVQKMNNKKPSKERLLLNEIDAQKYILSVADKYKIPETELDVTRKNLEYYQMALEEYYESHR